MKTRLKKPNQAGFTLVELLVVITIIATLAAVVFTMATKMKRNADGAKAIQNLRQIGSSLMTYSTENSARLPAARGDVPNGNGGFNQLLWHETVMRLTYPDVDPEYLRDNKWWIENKPFLRNPFCTADTKPRPFKWWNPGWAINNQLVRNLGLVTSESWAPGENGPQTIQIPLALLTDPARTPIIAPRHDWHYNYTQSQITDPDLQPFLVDGKASILFVDGHIENMKLTEYADRELHLMPKR